jgi:hypothetical protein
MTFDKFEKSTSLLIFVIITIANAAVLNTNILNGPDNVVYYGINNQVDGYKNMLAGSDNYIAG